MIKKQIRNPKSKIQNSFGTLRAIVEAASLMKLIETPPPTLLRARFATALDHLPSVPSVVLPIVSPVRNNRTLLLLKPVFIE